MAEPVPIPPDDAERLAALRALGILDTPDEERFDRITRIAARTFDVPIALVSLVDADRQWTKSLRRPHRRRAARATRRSAPAAILGETALVVEDTLDDPVFADNPQVTGAAVPALLRRPS